ncbi:LTA synthase family protein [Paenibacillus terrigena]|uniref:LTA synthase family protein n=1 Tax=Paenibacillus terrigena TaxID=369333 RepID=UPI000366C0F8|nr:LTA synthase family protein [Paenibacillus terrigena]
MREMENTFAKKIPIFFWAILCAFGKLVLMRYFFFEQMSVVQLLRDVFAICAIFGILELILPMRSKRYVYWGVNFLLSFICFAATLYYDHFGSVATYTALTALHQVTEIGDSVKATIRPIYYIYFLDTLVMAVIWLFTRRRPPADSSPIRRRYWKIGMLAVTVICLVLSGRTVMQNKAMDNELALAQDIGFIDYQFAIALKARETNKMVEEGNINEVTQQVQTSEDTFTYRDKPLEAGQKPAHFGAAKGKNLIVVQMEAFQNFLINLKVNDQEITPVLNQLAKDSFYFPHIYQQIGPGNTSDAEFMSNTSIYPTGAIAMSTGYGDRELPSLPRLLGEDQYSTNTFHVNDVKFWDRIRLYPALAFNQYFDKPSFKNDQFNEFGASDEELYRVGVEKLSEISKKKQPFYAQFVTVSSHFPFKVPDRAKTIDLPADLASKQIGNYMYAQHYTDYALGQLIDSLKKNGMWENTVLVVYGDHFGLQPQDNNPEELSTALGIPYNEYVSRFNIPFMIHVPGMEKGQVVDRVGGQVDMMPTIANLMGISLEDQHFTAFGHDLLNIDHNIIGMRYYLPTGSFFNDDILFIPGKGFDDGKAINLSTLEPVTDLTPYKKDYDYILKFMKLSDTYVKMLPKRAP